MSRTGERAGLVPKKTQEPLWPKRALVLWWCLALAVLVCTERFTFKVLVDRLEPYRYVVAQAVLVCYLFIHLAFGIQKLVSGDITPEMHDFPKHKLAIMAGLDYLQLITMVVSAAYVAPTLTALLLQLSVPLTMAMACIASRARRYSLNHYIGALLLLSSAALCLYRPIRGIVEAEGSVMRQTSGSSMQSEETGDGALLRAMGWSTVAYAAATIPAALSGVYKEHSLAAFGLPMDPDYLALWLSAVQLLLALLTAPLAYRLQAALDPAAMAGGGANPGAVRDSLRHGWRCWLLMKGDGAGGGDDNGAQCSGALLLVLGHVAAAVLAASCVSRVLMAVVAVAEASGGHSARGSGGGSSSANASAAAVGASNAAAAVLSVYRSVAAGLLLAFAALATYAGCEGSPWVEESVNVLTGIGLVAALAGLEVYHSRPEPDSELFTTHRTSPTPNSQSLPQ